LIWLIFAYVAGVDHTNSSTWQIHGNSIFLNIYKLINNNEIVFQN